MKFLKKLNLSQKVLQAILLKKKYPFAVAWNITHRCNLDCNYCSLDKKNPPKELDTGSILSLIDQLAELGTKFITFSGGEPLLRDDIKEIIQHCNSKNINVGINTNGTLIQDKISEIVGVNEVQVSLDGPKNINDPQRGKGVHDKAIQAIEILQSHNINVNLSIVITNHTINDVQYMLDIAEKYKSGCYIHPADKILSGDSNVPFSLSSDVEEFKKIISFLIEKKQSGFKYISNSISGLKHLYHWPEPKNIFCLAELLFCIIEPDGKIFFCDMVPKYRERLVPIGDNFLETYKNLSLPYKCRECWCSSTIEFNMLGSFKLDSMLSVWKRFKEKS